MIKDLSHNVCTKDMDLDAGSLTTSLSSIIQGCPFNAFKIFIYLFTLLFFTGFKTFITIFLSSLMDMPVYTSEYLPLPILVMISYLSISLFVAWSTRIRFHRLRNYSRTNPCAY